MTLRMVAEQRKDYGFSDAYEIYVSCDWCGEWIRELRDGVYCWRTHPLTTVCVDGTIHFVHIECWAGFTTANSGDWGWSWKKMLDLYMNLLGNLRPLGDQERQARLRARGHLEDMVYPDAGEPGSEFRVVTQQELERWKQAYPTVALAEGRVYEETVRLRRMDRAQQEMDETLGELTRHIESEPAIECPGEDVATQDIDTPAAE